MLWELCSDPEKRRSTAKVILDGRKRPFQLLLLFSFCHYSGMSLRVPCCKELMEAALIGSHLPIHINRMNALAPADNFTRISRLSNCQAIPKRLEIGGRVDLVLCRTHGTYVVPERHSCTLMHGTYARRINHHPPSLAPDRSQLSQGFKIRPSDRFLSAYNRC
jgi:hypothetical protein